MALAHIAPGKLFDACRYWYPEPQRTRKLILAGCGYQRATETDFGRVLADGLELLLDQPNWTWSVIDRGRIGLLTAVPDKFAYDSLWLFGPPNIPRGPSCEELNGITLCVFGELTEDEARKSPEVDRFDPAWQTEAVVGMAAKAYDERAFGIMPILADALEEAGCDNLPMLSHCREATIHTRGCWVLDHILGKG